MSTTNDLPIVDDRVYRVDYASQPAATGHIFEPSGKLVHTVVVDVSTASGLRAELTELVSHHVGHVVDTELHETGSSDYPDEPIPLDEWVRARGWGIGPLVGDRLAFEATEAFVPNTSQPLKVRTQYTPGVNESTWHCAWGQTGTVEGRIDGGRAWAVRPDDPGAWLKAQGGLIIVPNRFLMRHTRRCGSRVKYEDFAQGAAVMRILRSMLGAAAVATELIPEHHVDSEGRTLDLREVTIRGEGARFEFQRTGRTVTVEINSPYVGAKTFGSVSVDSSDHAEKSEA